MELYLKNLISTDKTNNKQLKYLISIRPTDLITK